MHMEYPGWFILASMVTAHQLDQHLGQGHFNIKVMVKVKGMLRLKVIFKVNAIVQGLDCSKLVISTSDKVMFKVKVIIIQNQAFQGQVQTPGHCMVKVKYKVISM